MYITNFFFILRTIKVSLENFKRKAKYKLSCALSKSVASANFIGNAANVKDFQIVETTDNLTGSRGMADNGQKKWELRIEMRLVFNLDIDL